MRKLTLLSLAALVSLAGAVNAQTAGGPAQASPGAMPSQTPLTSSGAPRTTDHADAAGAATPATPQAIGANKPAKPRVVRRHQIRATPAKAPPDAVMHQ